MGKSNRSRAMFAAISVLVALVCLPASATALSRARQDQPRFGSTASGFSVDGKVALNAFVSLCDEHLRKLADTLDLVAGGMASRTPNWDGVRPSLSQVANTNIPAVLWFALPDGTYWSLDQGRIPEKLSSRPYFPRVMAGERVVGDLVVSRSTGKSVAIIAVPIVGPNKTVSGVLGASVYLDRLSALIQQEMSLGNGVIFYSFDAAPLLGLEWDPKLIFADPTKLGAPVANAIREMLKHNQGVVSYTFRGVRRTVLYRKSSLTGWWYAFGVTQATRPSKSRSAPKS